MRKLSVLTLGLMAILSLVSCSKEDLQRTTATGSVAEPAPFSVNYSNWQSDRSLIWTDPSSNGPEREITQDVSYITQDIIVNDGMLVFIKSDVDGSIRRMPATFYDMSDSTNFDHYDFELEDGLITFNHFKVVGGLDEKPNDTNGMSFRFIAVSELMPSPNGRPDPNINTINELRSLEYDEIVKILGIPK
jgi:hypothetical protein